MSHLFVASHATDLESDGAAAVLDPLRTAKAAYVAALSVGGANLMSSHVDAWRKLWDQSAIEVEGDELLARAVWSAAYPIVSSIRADWCVSYICVLFAPREEFVMAFFSVRFEKHMDLRCPIVGESTMASHLAGYSRARHLLLQTDSVEGASTIWVTSSGIGEWRTYRSPRLIDLLWLVLSSFGIDLLTV